MLRSKYVQEQVWSRGSEEPDLSLCGGNCGNVEMGTVTIKGWAVIYQVNKKRKKNM